MFRLVTIARGTLFFQSAQVFRKVDFLAAGAALGNSLRRHPRIDILLRLLDTALADWQGQFQIHQYARSLEVCTKSWAAESCVRVHIHAFVAA